MTIPDLNKLRYATDDGVTTEPSEGKKNIGFVIGEEPSANNWNWLQNKSFQRFKQLQGGEHHKIVGNSTQVSQFTADYTVADIFENIASGEKILFLDGVHILTAPKTVAFSDIEIYCQSPDAVLDIAGYIVTFSGDRLRGQINVINADPGEFVISGANIEKLELRINDSAALDFNGSGTIMVNGELISKELTTLRLSNEPDHVILTASEQSLYSNDNRFVRYDAATSEFKRRDNTVVTPADGSWLVVKSVETLTGHLRFTGNRLKIETYRGFLIPLGNQGDNIPYAIFVRGNNCKVELLLDKTVRGLASALGDDKDTPMSNGLTAMENRRVIKNQGENNYILYNREQIFSGGAPAAHMDFVKPNHPYLLEWEDRQYEGLLRTGSADNQGKCWFSDLYYWLDRRYNPAPVPNPDLLFVYNTVTLPPKGAYFGRPVGLDDPDRHSRSVRFGELAYVIAAADYTQVSDKIILQNNAARDIKNVKSGIRVQATGIPSGGSGTTIVRPGSIVTTPGSESFLIMDAEDNSPVTVSASGNLTLDFSGMAAGSVQSDALQNLTGSFEIRANAITNDPNLPDGVFADIDFNGGTAAQIVQTIGSTLRDIVYFDASDSPGARTAAETRAINMAVIHYYRL